MKDFDPALACLQQELSHLEYNIMEDQEKIEFLRKRVIENNTRKAAIEFAYGIVMDKVEE